MTISKISAVGEIGTFEYESVELPMFLLHLMLGSAKKKHFEDAMEHADAIVPPPGMTKCQGLVFALYQTYLNFGNHKSVPGDAPMAVEFEIAGDGEVERLTNGQAKNIIHGWLKNKGDHPGKSVAHGKKVDEFLNRFFDND